MICAIALYALSHISLIADVAAFSTKSNSDNSLLPSVGNRFEMSQWWVINSGTLIVALRP